jgi:hypothetical protein
MKILRLNKFILIFALLIIPAPLRAQEAAPPLWRVLNFDVTANLPCNSDRRQSAF